MSVAKKANGKRIGKFSANGSEHGEIDSADERELLGTEDEKTVKCWYMVRLPKPEGKFQVTETSSLEALAQLKQERIDYLTAAMRVKQVSKSNAHEHTEAALDVLKIAGSEIREKIDVLKPLQERLNAHQKEESTVRNLLRELKIGSEEELDQTIVSLEQRISHESMALAVEKQLIRQIKQLQASREAVRDCNARKASISSARAERDELRVVVKVLKEEVDLLRLQENMQREVFRKRHDEEKSFETSIKEIISERQTVINEREQIRDEIRALRNSVRKEEGEYHKHRRLIRKLRELVEKKDYEAADLFSSEHLERVHGRLSTDAAYREEYLRLMRKQNPRRYFDSDDEDLGLSSEPSIVNAAPTDRLTQEQVRQKAKAFIHELINPSAPAPSVQEQNEPSLNVIHVETEKEEPTGPSTPPSKEATKPLASKQEALIKPEPNRGRKIPQLPELIKRGESASSREEEPLDIETNEMPTYQEDPAMVARARQVEAEERKRRLADKAAKAKVAAEARALEEARKKADKKARKRVGKTVDEVKSDEQEIPDQTDSVLGNSHSTGAFAPTVSGTSTSSAQPVSLRRYVKKGKVIVETPAAAQWRKLQQIATVAAICVFIITLMYVFRNSFHQS